MGVKEIDKQIKELLARRGPVAIELLEIDKELSRLRGEKVSHIQKSSFTWKGKKYKVSDIRFFHNWDYEDCPYTPGYRPGQRSIEFWREGEEPYQRVYFYGREKMAEFEEFFLKRFGVKIQDVVKETRKNIN